MAREPARLDPEDVGGMRVVAFAIISALATLCLLAVLALWLWGGALISAAQAHEWYPHECCSDRDCWPMGDAADAREPDPVATPQGWRLADGAVVPYAAARPSPDGRFHVCRRSGQADGEVIRPEGRKPCLFTPQQQF